MLVILQCIFVEAVIGYFYDILYRLENDDVVSVSFSLFRER